MQTSSNAERRLRKRAQQYLASGLMEPAKATLESLLQHAPTDPSIHQSLASVLMHLQYPDAACASLLEAARHLSAQPNIAENLAQQLMLCGQSKAAHEMLLHLDPDQVSEPAGLLSVSQAYHALGDSAAALTWMEHALASGVDTPNDHFLHGLLLEYAGRLDDAEHCLDRSVTRWPQFASSALERSRLKKQSESSNHVDALQGMMAKASPGSLAEAEFAFALSKELDDLGRYEEAWQALQRGNTIMKVRNPYHGQTDELLVDTMLRSDRPRAGATQHAAGPTPIFIVGLPRSGTTLLDRILSSHSRVTSAGEIGDFLRITQWMTGALGEDIRTLVQFVERTAKIDPMELGRRYLEQTRWR
ncbi:MAG TPA: sulfotransferase, partial [Oleiagrimonas sp.]|nr:sulfotransferase [Oleiagrimonas sp.]